MNLGRLKPPQLSSTGKKESMPEKLLALPVVTDYEQVTNLLLVNPDNIDIIAKLEWLPYYIFNFEINKKSAILRKRSTESRTCIVNANTGERLEEYNEDDKSFFRFIPKEYWEPKDFEVAKDIEGDQIIKDLTTKSSVIINVVVPSSKCFVQIF
jgi:hypothetical protein